MTMTMYARHRHRDGFALLTTLWLSVAISALTLSFALEARHDRLEVANLAESTQAWAAARAGVATALSRLDRLSAGTAPVGAIPFDANDPWQWADTLVAEHQQLGDVSYDVHVIDAGARLDINRMSEDDWRNFLDALEVDGTVADQLAQTISDWRDPDDDARANGAERDAYVHAGRVILPANRNFGAVEELRDVLGMTPRIYTLIAPYLMVDGVAQISINTAPAPVLRTITAFTDNVVAVILSTRQSGQRINSLQDLIAMTGSGAASRLATLSPQDRTRLAFTTQTVTIESTGWSPDHRTSVRSLASVTRGTGATAIASIRWRKDE